MSFSPIEQFKQRYTDAKSQRKNQLWMDIVFPLMLLYFFFNDRWTSKPAMID